MFIRTVALRALFCATLLGSGACNQRHWVCEPADEREIARLPSRLSETGLFAEIATGKINEDVLAYTPRFELWSDGASKRRWMALPSGAQIDTSDMDSWLFPEGTKLWKEFVRDGVRVETRLLQKSGRGETDWVAISYLWSKDQSEAYAAREGALGALGTPHDVPAAGECMACHGGTRSRVLGVSAIQLEESALAELAARGVLPTVSPPLVPGSANERDALGYLHANCSHCHNPKRPERSGPRCFEPNNELDFRLLVGDLATVEDTRTYQTMGDFVVRGRPDDSGLIRAVATRDFFERMPPLAAKRTDHNALALLRAWIAGL